MLSDSLNAPARPISADLASSVEGLPLVLVEWRTGHAPHNGFQKLRGSPTYDGADQIALAYIAKQSGYHVAHRINRADILSIRPLPFDLGNAAAPVLTSDAALDRTAPVSGRS